MESQFGHELNQEQVIRCLTKLQNLKSQGSTYESDGTYRLLVKVVNNYLKKDQSFKKKFLNCTDDKFGMVFHKFRLLNAEEIEMIPAQKMMLKAQIYLLNNHLDRKKSIPLCLMNAVQGRFLPNSLIEYENCFMKNAKTSECEELKEEDDSEDEHDNKAEDSSLDLPPLPSFPIIEPSKGFENGFYKSRNRLLSAHIRKKKSYFMDTLNQEGKKTSDYDKLRSLVEVRKIDLVDQQMSLRNKLISSSRPILPLKTNIIPPPPSFSIPPRKTISRTYRLEMELKHQIEVISTTSFSKQKMLLQINKGIHSYFDRVRRRGGVTNKREQNRRIKRLEALRENDEQAYFKLLEKTKEKRILDLLKQTDMVLRKLGAQLKVKSGGEEVIISFPTSEQEMLSYQEHLRTRESYYSLVHKYQNELVTEAPKILVGGVLRSYQLTGLQWMISLYNNNINGILADEMGLGKTIQVIALFSYLYEKKQNLGPHLVLAPLSTIPNWANELRKWCPILKIFVYSGVSKARKDLEKKYFKVPGSFHVCITQYDFARRDKNILKKVKWNYIVVDEGHRLKNSKTKLVSILKQFHNEHRLLLTGTPVQNDLQELWSLLNFLLPKVFHSSEDFKKWFSSATMGKSGTKKGSRGRPKKTALEMDLNEEEKLLVIHRLHQVLRPFLLRREIQEVEHQLPQKQEYVIRVELSALQEVYYEMIQKKNSIIVPDYNKGILEEVRLQNIVMQLRKVCNHPFLFYNLSTIQLNEDLIRCSGKFAVLDAMLPKLLFTRHKILIFSQMTLLLDLLELFLKYRNILFFRFDGGVKSSIRDELINKFNDPNNISTNIFLLSTRSGGLGINLQVADTVIIFDSDWNPQQDKQAQARVWRIGQTQNVKIFTLLTVSPVEYKMYERAQMKKKAELKIIKAGKYNTKSTITERQEILKEILQINISDFKKSTGSSTPDFTTLDQLNKLISRTPREIELFKKIDESRTQRIKKFFDFFRQDLQEQHRLLKQKKNIDFDLFSLNDKKSNNKSNFDSSREESKFFLIKFNELPIWLTSKFSQELILDMSRKLGLRRTRKKTGGDDLQNLTDNKFLSLLEKSRKKDDEIFEDQQITGKKRKRKDRKKKKKKKKEKKKKKKTSLKISLKIPSIMLPRKPEGKSPILSPLSPATAYDGSKDGIFKRPPLLLTIPKVRRKGSKSVLQTVPTPRGEDLLSRYDNEDEELENKSNMNNSFKNSEDEDVDDERMRSFEPPLKKLKRIFGDDGKRFSISVPPLYHNYLSGDSLLSSKFQKDLYSFFKILVNLVQFYRSKKSKPGDIANQLKINSVCKMFVNLPDRKKYADYYEKIRNPISMRMIEEKIVMGKYQSFLEFEEDIRLLVTNCKNYNHPKLQIHHDAEFLWRRFHEEKRIYFEQNNGESHEKGFKNSNFLLGNGNQKNHLVENISKLLSEQDHEEEEIEEEGEDEIDGNGNQGNQRQVQLENFKGLDDSVDSAFAEFDGVMDEPLPDLSRIDSSLNIQIPSLEIVSPEKGEDQENVAVSIHSPSKIDEDFEFSFSGDDLDISNFGIPLNATELDEVESPTTPQPLDEIDYSLSDEPTSIFRNIANVSSSSGISGDDDVGEIPVPPPLDGLEDFISSGSVENNNSVISGDSMNDPPPAPPIDGIDEWLANKEVDQDELVDQDGAIPPPPPLDSFDEFINGVNESNIESEDGIPVPPPIDEFEDWENW